MKFYDKRLTARVSGLFALANFVVFIVYYIFNYLVMAPNDFVVYLIKFSTQTVDILLPFVAAATMLTRGAFLGRRKAMTGIIPFVCTRLIYLVPYYYLHLIYDGYDSIESLILGLVYSIPELIIYYLIIFALYSVITFVAKRAAKKRGIDPYGIESEIQNEEFLNFDNGVISGIFTSALLTFIYLVIREIIYTVSYFIEYAGNYQIGEIAYIAFSFVYDLAILFLCHIAACAVKNLIIKGRLIAEK